ncbi:hypothetical protein B0H16DRAFT_1465194 [Mycena metata]|uniref:RRM domain-containing protein n=1 Tax=Mycena metata TaxID=1033252 RepID=A0AAD7IBR9_9AGAR|nr:hypothetical protein B0H16DRAFT_1465194 [Mycena metata]
MDEATIIDIFETVGPIIGFRYGKIHVPIGLNDSQSKCYRRAGDRETGSNGDGFCDFYDEETAVAAVERLNGIYIAGHTIRVRIDRGPGTETQGRTTPQLNDKLPHHISLQHGNAQTAETTTNNRWLLNHKVTDASDLRRLEVSAAKIATEKTVQLYGSNHVGPLGRILFFLALVPPGIALAEQARPRDVITDRIAAMTEGELIEVLVHTQVDDAMYIIPTFNTTDDWICKGFMYTHPEETRALLRHYPQVTYAIVMALVLSHIVAPETFSGHYEDQVLDETPPTENTDVLQRLGTKGQTQSRLDSPSNARLDRRISSQPGDNYPVDLDDLSDDLYLYGQAKTVINGDAKAMAFAPPTQPKAQRLSRLLPLLDHMRLGTGSSEDARDLCSILSVLTQPQIDVLPELDQATLKAMIKLENPPRGSMHNASEDLCGSIIGNCQDF